MVQVRPLDLKMLLSIAQSKALIAILLHWRDLARGKAWESRPAINCAAVSLQATVALLGSRIADEVALKQHDTTSHLSCNNDELPP